MVSNPTEQLLLAVAQPLTVTGKPMLNARAHARTILSSQARVVVFPELSLTGYDFATPPMSLNDPAFELVAEACHSSGSVALVGAPILDEAGEGSAAIAMVAVSAERTWVAYRKMNLSDEESRHFRAGTSIGVLEVDRWRIGLAICRDCGQSDHVDQTVAAGIDIYVAGVLDSADNAAVLAKRAARITADHRVWVAMASFAGPTGEGYEQTAGCSTIWRPDGTRKAAASSRPGDVAMALLDAR